MRLPVTSSTERGYDDAEAVWRDMRGPLLAFIARRVPDRDTAEDILQDVMVRIHRHGTDITYPDAITGWLYRITRHAIADHYRRAAVRRERPVGTDIDLERAELVLSEPDSAELRSELVGCLRPLLDRLPAIYRDALQLTDLDGLTQTEAAALTGISTSGMKTRVQRARHQLKIQFTQCCDIALDRRGGIVAYHPNLENHPHTSDCNCSPA
jgi:RNA polymerase sigma-70 factor, ECF subfamily